MTTFIVTGADLAEAAGWASRVIPSRPAVPTLGGLLLDAGDELTVSGYDYDTALTAAIPATVTEPGRLLVSGRLLADIARVVPRTANVTVTTDGATVRVQAGRPVWELPQLPVDEFPTLPQLGEPVGAINAGVLRRAAARVLPVAGKDDTLPMLTGVKLEGSHDMLTFTATDRFRIATTTVDWDAAGQAVLDVLAPARLLEVATKALRADTDTVGVYGGDGGIGLATDTHRIVGRLLDVAFPRWQQLMLADANHYAIVDVPALQQAVDQALVLGEQHLRLDFAADLVEVSAAGDERRARADAPVLELAGEPMTVAVNPGYLRDALAAMGADQARIHFGGTATKPLLFAPVDDLTYRHVLVPVRLSQAERAA